MDGTFIWDERPWQVASGQRILACTQHVYCKGADVTVRDKPVGAAAACEREL